jgi:hypothetical protein
MTTPCPSWCREHDGHRFGDLWHNSELRRGPGDDELQGTRIDWRISALVAEDGSLQPPRISLFTSDGDLLYDDLLPIEVFAGLVEELTATLAEARS